MTEQERTIISQGHTIDNITSEIVNLYVRLRTDMNNEHQAYLYEMNKAKMYEVNSNDYAYCMESARYSAGRAQGYRDVMGMLEGILSDIKDDHYHV